MINRLWNMTCNQFIYWLLIWQLGINFDNVLQILQNWMSFIFDNIWYQIW